jgi:hypothetical protein
MLEVARAYFKRGWASVPVPHCKKGPRLKGWQRLRLTEADLPHYFNGHPQNIGVLLGAVSGGLVDVDLDCPAALALADRFLPSTAAVFGRQSKPRSHRLYRVTGPTPPTRRFQDPLAAPDDATLVELRADGCQTIFPPSVHPSGEVVRWDADGEPEEVDAATLARAVQHLAAAALLTRHWPGRGARHDTALALAGALLRAGWGEEEAEAFIAAVAEAAGDEETRDRVRTVASTVARLADGGEATGLTRLRGLIDARVVDALVSWLGLHERTRAVVAADTVATTAPYRNTAAGLVWEKPTKDGVVPVPLTNFTARIIADVVRDDGSGERTREFEIEATLAGGTRRFAVAADRFAGMAWVTEHLGAGAIVYPGQSTKEHARVAIQQLSGTVPERCVYTHTGWCTLPDGRRVYLHVGGALGADGPVAGVAVELPPALAPLQLPDPPAGAARRQAAFAELALLDLAPERVTVPLLGAVYRAVLGLAAPTDFSLHLSGATGVGKTELAALAQAHFGADFDARHLPGAWASTGNALEGLAFTAKDALLVVDDFAPGGDQRDVARLHREADRLLRAQGNLAGRARLRADATLRPARPPRGLIVSTGEDVPRGESLRARLLVLELAKGDLDWSRLTKAQAAAREGAYAGALAAFVGHVAAHADVVRDQFLRNRERWRAEALSALPAAHRRTAAIVAELGAAWEVVTWAWRVWDALSEGEAERLRARVREALLAAASAQQAHVQSADPARQFLELLDGAFIAGRAHLKALSGEAPADAERWGWRKEEEQVWCASSPRYRPQGDCIGWIDGDGSLLLDPAASFAVVQRLARDMGETLPVTERTLRRRLAEAGWLASSEPGRGTLLSRRSVGGTRRQVLHLRGEALSGENLDQSDQCDRADQNDTADAVDTVGAVDGGVGAAAVRRR